MMFVGTAEFDFVTDSLLMNAPVWRLGGNTELARAPIT